MIQLTAEQQRQVHEDRQRQEHQDMLRAACDKIMQGIARNNNRSGERAIWELMQNAGDLSQNAITSIILTNESIEFAHKGESFDLNTLTNLIKQQSSKNDGDDKIGQYGTGFMTTHVFNRKVYVRGDCRIDFGGGKMYVALPSDFCLDRSFDDKDAFTNEMDRELKIADNLVSKEGKEQAGEWTSFYYPLTSEQIERIADQLDVTTKLMPFVMVFNDCIAQCTIENRIINTSIVYAKNPERRKVVLPYDSNYCKVLTTIGITEHGQTKDITIISIERADGSDRIIIPPLPNGFDDTDCIPSQFLFFPMLGTENFGTNFIFHSSRLFPTEPRSSYLLPQDNYGLEKKYKHNEQVLEDMIKMLFAYYQNDISQQNIPLNFSRIDFRYDGEDDITKLYYEKLQKRFSNELVKWKMIPTEKGFLSIEEDSDFVVFDSDIYKDLNEEELLTYIPVITKYANQILTIPNKDIVQWSEVVKGWAPNNANYYIKLDSICRNIKIKDGDLHIFLLHLKKLGKVGIDLLASNALIPNRDNLLKKSGDLRNGKNITPELYNIAKPILGTKASRLIDTEYTDIVVLPEYTRIDFRDDIKSSIDDLRKLSLGNMTHGISQPKLLENLTNNITVEELIRYCSAFTSSESTSYRARLMPVICKLYNINYEPIVIASIDSEEPDLYLSAFSFLVDNTMLMLSQKESTWLMSDKGYEHNYDLLLLFAQIFSDTKDEQRIKKLDDYGIIPNQLGAVNKIKDLKQNISIDEELQKLYKDVFKRDLKESFVDNNFSSIYSFSEYQPEEVGDAIEKQLKAINYKGTDIIYIINQLNKGFWRDYFPNIFARREDLYYTHGTDEDKDALFRIQMQGSEKIKRIAQLSESADFDAIMNKAEGLLRLQQEHERQLRFTFAIGKLIEDDIRREVNDELICLPLETSNELSAEDMQYGQDMIISYKDTPLYYIECKAKWNFTEPAHMSSLQIKQAVRKFENYALCCIDCTPDTGCQISPNATDEEVKAAHSDILSHTYVHTNIGEVLSSTISPILNHEDDSTLSEDVNIKIYGSFSCNISKRIFIKGTPFSTFIQELRQVLETKIKSLN